MTITTYETKLTYENLMKRSKSDLAYLTLLIANISQQREAENARLQEALGELAIWWENWMPDEAREQGGYEALEVARQALAGEEE